MPDGAVLEPEPPDLAGLGALPAVFAETREALHRLAERVLSPVQAGVNGDIHFRWTPGGFGTPRFGEARQLRVEGATVVAVDGDELRRAPITSLREAAAFVGADAAAQGDEPLEVDEAAARWLGDFYGFAFGLLLQLAAEGLDPAPIRLWPEHFDIATDVGDEAAGTRVTLGASPGDANHAEPYLYVLPWTAPEPGELWQATGFTGAELTLAELLATDDQRAAAREFFRTRLAAVG